MKKTTIFALALVLALLAQFACAEPSAVVRGVFDALTAEDSYYNQTKAMYAEYYGDIQWEESVQDDSIVINISNSAYMDGSWTFTQEGEYLTAAFDDEDYTGLSMAMSMLKAVGSYLGMETDVLNGYVNGLNFLGIKNDCFIMEQDEAAGTITVRINDAAPWDMAELNEMVLDEAVVEPMEEGYTSTAANFGKLMMVANAMDDGMVILLGEYGGLDDLAYRSIINVVSILKPAGWEDFTANYTKLADVEADAYTVKLDADMAAVNEIIDDAKESYSYAIIRFTAGEGKEDVDFERPAPSKAPTAEELTEGYFNVLANLPFDTAGASLKTAVAASKACAFAESYALYNPDVETLRANMLEAFEAMDEDGQTAFLKAFDVVRALLDDCLADYEANRAVFEDAGVVDVMDEVMYDPLNRLAWENLRDHTLTMGNDMNAG